MSKQKSDLLLVTGGAGFIGSHLVDSLLAEDYKVICLDDFSSGKQSNIKHHKDNPNFHVLKVDLNHTNEVEAVFKEHKISHVFHLATKNVRQSINQPTIVHELNTNATYNLLKLSSKYNIGKFLYCSSSEIYGTATTVPMPEDYFFEPLTIYGASKLTGEYYTKVFNHSGWLNTLIARPHNNYGPREHYESFLGEVIPRFILQAFKNEDITVFGDGKQTRDFTYVTETAAIIKDLMFHPESSGKAFNICKGEEVDVLTIAKKIIKITNSSSKIIHLPARPNDVLRLYGECSKLKSFLGKSPLKNIDDGLNETIYWFEKEFADGNIKDDCQQMNYLLENEDWII